VIGMRLTFLADGGQSELGEAVRMASEKATAALEVQQAAAIAALTGKAAQIPARTLPIYRRKTRSNIHRRTSPKSPARTAPSTRFSTRPT
jgi:hypothetical protein